jgi:hydroxyacyl-ACP dehydratase HTD2-like protein with hotdog domain
MAVGMDLPPMVKSASRAQLFLFSAATWNPHRVHYDKDFAIESDGQADVIVHGPLQGAWLSQYLMDWAGPRGRVVHLAWQNRAPILPDTEVTFRGRVTGKRETPEGRLIDLEVTEEDATGRVFMPATATVALP